MLFKTFLEYSFFRRIILNVFLKKFFEPVQFVSKLSRGVHFEDNLEYTFENFLLKPLRYFRKFS